MSLGVKVAERDHSIIGELDAFEVTRYIDRNDPRWFHPELQNYVAMCLEMETAEGNTLWLCDDSIPLAERLAVRQGIYDAFEGMKQQALDAAPELRDFAENKTYEASGCEEDPDTSVQVLVRTPKARKAGEKSPVIFYCMGGALVLACPAMHPIPELCLKHNAVVVCPLFRTSVDAPYPAAINDVHAAYKWMIENAEKLGIDTDQVIIYGGSSGAHLASCLTFRLKRYGGYDVHPRGCILIDPVLDDRYTLPSHRMLFYLNDSRTYHTFNKHYVGETNFGSPYIGPEAFANHALPEECRGLPPMFIHTGEHDAERDVVFEFAQKLYAAEVWTEVHQWGGCFHAIQQVTDSDLVKRYEALVDSSIEDCLKYDLRRLWNN
jgi:acetyl esterase/lipase